MKVRFIPASDTRENWLAKNPVALPGEICVEIDTGRWKFGDGRRPYSELPYAKQDFTQELQQLAAEMQGVVDAEAEREALYQQLLALQEILGEDPTVELAQAVAALQDALADVGDIVTQSEFTQHKLDYANYQELMGRVDVVNVSSNLFDKDTVIFRKVLDAITGELGDSSGGNCTSDWIPILPNTPYTAYCSTSITRIVYYTANKQFISSTQGNGTKISPKNAYWVRMSVLQPLISNTQFNKGNELLPYEAYSKAIKDELLPSTIDGTRINNHSIPIKKLDFVYQSTNLLNKETVVTNKVISAGQGELSDSDNYNVSDFIEVSPDTTYTTLGMLRITFYSEDKTYLAGSGNPVGASGGFPKHTITTPSSCRYIRVSIAKWLIDEAQINLGDTLLPYEPYREWIPSNFIEPERSDKESKSYYFTPEEIIGHYKPTDTLGYDELSTQPIVTTIQNYFDKLLELETNNPEYMKSTLLGIDSSGQYPIYKFELNPQVVSATGFQKELPKVIIASGLHGSEKESVFSLFYLMKDIIENWDKDSVLEYLRWNVSLIFIPSVNPWSFMNNTRKNYNGVDINRNFPINWVQGSDPSANTYGGASHVSEVESVYLKEVIDEHSDAILFGDFHTNGSSGNVYDNLMWNSLVGGEYSDEDIDIFVKQVISKQTREFIKRYSQPADQGFFGYISYARTGGFCKVYPASLGMKSLTVEGFRKFPNDTEYSNPIAIKANTEYIGNWIATALQHFKNSYHV